ncbi:PKD domain-containing protein [Aurantibacter sp.]|uniref:PKD domain-containing protein n=1 Tax=Aurantibacter sp. TaxID=2807103 RepID=UPI0035C7F6E8
MKKILLLSFITIAFVSCSKDNEIEAEPSAAQEELIADFRFESTVVNEDSDLNITNLSKGVTTYVWDFGNDNVFTEETPDYKYLSHGFYNVTLTVKNDINQEASITKEIEVLCNFGGGNHGPDTTDF